MQKVPRYWREHSFCEPRVSVVDGEEKRVPPEGWEPEQWKPEDE
jgi:hypothetical protein